MPVVSTWMRKKDEKYFAPFFARFPKVRLANAARGELVPEAETAGLLLTGGADIAPQFLEQVVPNASALDLESDSKRDSWEFEATKGALARRLPIFAICKGLQVLNVALGGTLLLDIHDHNLPEQKEHDVQPLRVARSVKHYFEKVNSSHHQAIDQLGAGLVVEAWCARDDVIEQVRLENYPFGLGVQYHPERGRIYDDLFADFVAHL